MDNDKELLINEGKISNIEVYEEVRSSFLSYAMSVIVSRALPDACDGLKPVHRRILYGANELKIFANSQFKKSARLVGEVMGKYHPHGDMAIYNSIVRMAQNFNMRYPLIDGHGNFGSIDGDSAAAMRYTEIRMTRIAQEILLDVDKDVIDFRDNYDGSEREPIVLPSYFPNLLVNGSTGIAVGMATSIPPHNINNVVDALTALIENKEISINDLISIIKGPDFPTGGIVSSVSRIYNSYETGVGSVVLRGKVILEDNAIIIYEIPYQVNKSRLIERIAQLAKDKIIEGIRDLRDESNKNGIRIVIETKNTTDPEFVLNLLYKNTQLQTSFNIHYLALVNNVPKTLNLKSMLEVYLEHRLVVLTRKTEFELQKNEDKHHIIKGLCIALEKVDEVIEILKNATNSQEASTFLIEKFHLSEKQTKAVLEMRLQRIVGLEKLKLEEELSELNKNIIELKSILNDSNKKFQIIKEQLITIKNAYGDERRTEISDNVESISDEALIKEEEIVVLLSKNDYIKKIPIIEYRSQNKGGVGSNTINFNDGDYLDQVIFGGTHDYYYFFTKLGKVYRIKGYQIYTKSKQSKGIPVVNLIESFDKNDKIQSILAIKQEDLGSNDEHSLVFLTKKGLIKKSSISHYINVNRNGKIAINLNEDDEIVNVLYTNSKTEIIISTFFGNALKISLDQIRNLGRNSLGVKAINLINKKDNYLMSGTDTSAGSYLLCVTDKGIGKLIEINTLPLRGRGTQGLPLINKKMDIGKLVGVKAVNNNDEVMFATKKGKIIRICVEDIATRKSRTSRGIKLMDVKDDDRLVNIAIVSGIEKFDEDFSSEEVQILEMIKYNEETD